MQRTSVHSRFLLREAAKAEHHCEGQAFTFDFFALGMSANRLMGAMATETGFVGGRLFPGLHRTPRRDFAIVGVLTCAKITPRLNRGKPYYDSNIIYKL